MTKLNANLLAWRIGVFGSLLIGSWCGMVTTHEAGHIIGGWLTGARLIQADLRPWALPYTMFDPNPMPLVTMWSGPVLGSLMPLLAAMAIRHPVGWFNAWFCVLANGAYLALAWLTGDQYLDTTQLLVLGGSPLSIATFCIVTIAAGYFGFRKSCLEFLKPPERKPTS
jgi:hypothetical protein